MKIQSLKSLEAEMRAVARGEKLAPPDAAQPSIESAGLLENDPRFLRRIAKARKSLRAGRGVRLEDVK